MGGKKLKKANECNVCGKKIREENKSGLCSHHYRMKYWRKRRKERKKKRLCIICAKKVEPKIVYPAGDTISPIITYPVRCYLCRKRQNKSYKNTTIKSKKQQKTESVTTLK